MLSSEHESPLALANAEPTLVGGLLAGIFDMKVSVYHHARTDSTDIRVLVPRTYHADAVVAFCDEADRPLQAAVMEVQRGWDVRKQRTWKLYVAQLEAELGVDVALLVHCPDPALARRYSDMFAQGGLSLSLRPFIFTPEDVPLVVDPAEARANPSMAVLAAVCHGGDADVDDAFPALAEALSAAGPEKSILYYDVVLSGLPEAARTRWEAFMSTTAGYEFQSDFAKRYIGQGEARAVLTVLEGRGIPVPDEVRDQILACTDLAQLDIWLRRAISATRVEDVIG